MKKRTTLSSLPFIPILQRKIINFFKNNSCAKMTYKNNKLNKFIKNQKHSLSKWLHYDVVYKIDCKSCDVV